jgi:hypothetical protein
MEQIISIIMCSSLVGGRPAFILKGGSSMASCSVLPSRGQVRKLLVALCMLKCQRHLAHLEVPVLGTIRPSCSCVLCFFLLQYHLLANEKTVLLFPSLDHGTRPGPWTLFFYNQYFICISNIMHYDFFHLWHFNKMFTEFNGCSRHLQMRKKGDNLYSFMIKNYQLLLERCHLVLL